ncbi:hypothetical protein SCA6_010595 [Theobroma cacao]
MQDSSRPVTGYPVQNLNGCAPPPPASSATAYPYVNPNPYPYYPPPTPQNPRPTFFRRLFVAFAILVIIFGTILLIFWLVLRPHLPDFSLESLSLSNFNASNQRVTATWNAQFQVFNPNKKLSISYGDVVSSVFHKDYFLTETRIGPFVQGTRNVSTVQASYSVVDSYVEAKVVDAINGERSRGEVKFSVNVLADVAFRYGGWRGRRRVLRVRCNDVALSGSSGKMTGMMKFDLKKRPNWLPLADYHNTTEVCIGYLIGGSLMVSNSLPTGCYLPLSKMVITMKDAVYLRERMAKRRLTTVNPTAYCTAFPFMFIAKGKRRKEEQIDGSSAIIAFEV